MACPLVEELFFCGFPNLYLKINMQKRTGGEHSKSKVKKVMSSFIKMHNRNNRKISYFSNY